jgi:hypothetical protein
MDASGVQAGCSRLQVARRQCTRERRTACVQEFTTGEILVPGHTHLMPTLYRVTEVAQVLGKSPFRVLRRATRRQGVPSPVESRSQPESSAAHRSRRVHSRAVLRKAVDRRQYGLSHVKRRRLRRPAIIAG